MQLRIIIAVLIIYGSVLATIPVHADCVADVISGNVVWSPEEGDKHICGSVLHEDGTLTINPSVNIVFADGASIEFAGGLNIPASNESPVIFRGEPNAFWTVGFSSLDYQQFLNGVVFHEPVRPIDFSSANATLGDILVTGGAGIEFGPGNYELSRVELSVDFGDALAFYGGKAHLHDVLIGGSGLLSGLSLYDRAEVVVSSSTIHYSTIAGIAVYDSLIKADRVRVLGGGLVGIEIYGDSEVSFSTTTVTGFVYGAAGFGSDTVSLSGIWWGSSNEPQEGIDYLGDITFVPWLKRDPFSLLPRVVFFPGIQASRLTLNEDGSVNQLWEPNRRRDVELLLLDESGHSVNSDISVGEVIDEINVAIPRKNIYKTFLEKLTLWKDTGVIEDSLVVPYDWRESIVQVAEEVLENLVDFSPTILIGHSNGGLLARVLLNMLPEEMRGGVRLLLVGSPQLGSFQGLASILHGDSLALLGGLIMDSDLGQKFLKYMVSAYTLLPWGINEDRIFIEGGDKAVLSWQELIEDFPFLPSKYRADFSLPNISTSTLKKAEEAYQLATRTPLHASTTLIIYGSQRKTPVGLTYEIKSGCFWRELLSIGSDCSKKEKVSYVMRYGDGDGTVESQSASAISHWEGEQNSIAIDLTRDGVKHANMLESASVLAAVESYIAGNHIAEAPSSSEKAYVAVSVHSPVSLLAKDKHGNQTGIILKDQESWLVEDIPNSTYHRYGEAKEIIIEAEDPHEEYFFEIQGEDSDYFTLRINNSEIEGIPVGPESIGSFSVTAEREVVSVKYHPLGIDKEEYNLVVGGASDNDFPFEQVEQEIFDHAVKYYCIDPATKRVRVK